LDNFNWDTDFIISILDLDIIEVNRSAEIRDFSAEH